MKTSMVLVWMTCCTKPLFAMTNLVLVGGQSRYSSVAFGSRPPAWLPYLIPMICFLAGAMQFFYPRIAWRLKMLGKRWQFDGDIEPSSLWLFFARLGGLLMVMVSVILFIAVYNGSPIIPTHQ